MEEGTLNLDKKIEDVEKKIHELEELIAPIQVKPLQERSAREFEELSELRKQLCRKEEQLQKLREEKLFTLKAKKEQAGQCLKLMWHCN